jgi:ABC-type Fe3+-siderophore transport system permease subunit
MMSPKEHAKLLGLFLWIYAGLHFLIFGFVALVWFGIFGAIMSEASRRPQRGNSPNPEAIAGIAVVFIIIAVVVLVVFLMPKVVAGFGLRKGRSWAKVWTIVACCVAVLNFPLGTALGVYGFWFVFGDLGKTYFENPHATDHFSPPPPNNWQ